MIKIDSRHERGAARMFFDFYALSILRFFAGERTLNHGCRADRIERSYEEVVDLFYEEIRRALHYSVLREFRHFNGRTTLPRRNKRNARIKRFAELSKRLNKLYDYGVGSLDKYLWKESDGESFQNIDLGDIEAGFNDFRWDTLYGGKAWGKAAGFLLQDPKTTLNKELWIDRVLDLQHNCGHILNKTKFRVLSLRNKVPNPRTKGRRTILNHRRYAQTIRELSSYGSARTKKLVNTNLNLVPEIVR